MTAVLEDASFFIVRNARSNLEPLTLNLELIRGETNNHKEQKSLFRILH